MKRLLLFPMIFAFWAFSAVGAQAEPVNAADIIVKDGDSIVLNGIEYRMIGYDSPETTNVPWRKVSAEEKLIGAISKQRLSDLLREGPIDLKDMPCSCSAKKFKNGTCNHGRKCGVLSVNGRNVGETLIVEELAVPFACGKTRCQKMPDWPKIIRAQFPPNEPRQ
ncbi:thermonuclease family protein [Bradyrhizobium sp. Mp27]|uniref:thermonuclease family protein n=1 Tax=Bradyrhizobium sp. Mp27 TaxID=3042157 RepID=UPI00248D3720|nr:thermonuclease family protein [Bradyrhizobium sp. Mp27]MDI2077480.1 thermonuclease family protein [Bradyrhizobium sp. Mp27]